MSTICNILFPDCHNIVEQYVRRINVAILHSIVILPEYCHAMSKGTIVSRRQVMHGGAAPRQQCLFYAKRCIDRSFPNYRISI